MKWILSSVVFILAIAVGLLFFVQSKWAKDKIGTILEEVALQQGLKLKIEKIEGDLPLKWSLSGVHLELNETDSITIDQMRIRLSILPLLRKKIGISYLSADHLVYRFAAKENSQLPKIETLPQSLSIQMLKLNQVEVINLTTKETAAYTISGSCHFKKRSFDVFVKLHSDELDGTVLVQGGKKNQQAVADLNLHVFSEKAFAPFAAIPYQIPFHLETQLSLFSDRSLDISSFVLKSDLLDIQGRGRFDADLIPRNLKCTFSLSQLSLLTPYLEGMIKGDIHYTENDCRVEIVSDQFKLRKASFKDGSFNLTAHRDQQEWSGTIETTASHPELEFKGTSDFTYHARRLELENISLRAPESSLVGDFSIDFMSNLSGGLALQIGNLKRFSELSPLPLAGQIGGQIEFTESSCRSHLIAKACKAGPFISDQVVIDCLVTDLFKNAKGNFDIEIQKSYFADIFFGSGHCAMSWNSQDWTYQLQTEGWWKSPFDIDSQGRFSFNPAQLQCNSLKGNLLLKKLELQQPFTLNFTKDGAALSNLALNINEGYFHSTFQVTPEKSLIQVQAQHFPLDFLTLLSPRLSLQGLSSIDVSLEGTNHDLTGHLNFLLERADIYPAGMTVPIQTKASFQAHLNHDKIQLHSHIVATGEQFVEFSATLPLSYQVYPFKLQVDREKSFAAQCTIEGHIEQLFDFINIGTQRFGGFLSTKLVGSGTLAKPALFGPLSIQNGFYQNYLVGISLKNTNIEAIANGSMLNAEQITLTDAEKGTASAKGFIQIEPALSYSVEGDISNFSLVHFDWLDAACSGPFKLSGDLQETLGQGTLTVDKAEIQIPDQLPPNLTALPVTFINQPESHLPSAPPREPYPFRYDLKIQGEKNIHLTGHGIDAELSGNLYLTGADQDITTAGTLKVNKGKFSFAGKDFKITDGEVSFTKEENFINLTSNLDLSDLNVTVTFRGSFSSPQLNFQSNPPLPTSSILARILFNKDVSELNASQAAQLAYTIINLSSGSGPNLLETIHKNLGIDRLGISANEETGNVSVQIGKYLTEGVMITLLQSTEHSHVIVEVELKGGFVLQAETHFNDQGKFIFKWNKNY